MYSTFINEWLPKKTTLQEIAAPPENVNQSDPRAEPLKSAGPSDPHLRPAEERDKERKDLLNSALSVFDKLREYREMLEKHQKRAK